MKKSAVLFTGSLLIGAFAVYTPLASAAQTNAVVNYSAGTVVFDPAATLPKDLNFGSHEIQSKTDETWTATTDGAQASPATTGSVSVSDNRGGNAQGWNIKLVQTTQFTAGSDTLTGAALSITAGAITNNVGNPPVGPNITNTVKQLTVGTTENVMTANASEGAGETSLALQKFTLFVPKDHSKKAANYQTTLNWTFSSTP